MAKLTSELLRPVDAAHVLDEAALLSYAAAHVPGFPSPAPALALAQFGHGQSNPTYCLQASAPGGETRRYVLRKKPPGAILQSAHAVEREFQVERWERQYLSSIGEGKPARYQKMLDLARKPHISGAGASCVPNRTTCSRNSTVELLHGGVGGAELEKLEQSSPKQAFSCCVNSKPCIN